MKREAELRTKFLVEWRRQVPRSLALRHEDTLESGKPDLTLVANKHDSWIEFKHATPTFSGFGLQELTCCDLAREGYCRYVVWMEGAEGLMTMVIHPEVVRNSVGRPQNRKPWLMKPEAMTSGFDQKWLVAYFRQVHQI